MRAVLLFVAAALLACGAVPVQSAFAGPVPVELLSPLFPADQDARIPADIAGTDPTHAESAAALRLDLVQAPLATASSAPVPQPRGRISRMLATPILTESAEPGVLSLLAMGALLCRLGARAIGVKR